MAPFINFILEDQTTFLSDYLPREGEHVLIRDRRLKVIYRVDRIVNVFKSASDQYNQATVDHWNVFLTPVAASE